jgi:hypothetical protein
MSKISDLDRTMIFNTINQNSDCFTEYEVDQIHEAALKLNEIHKALIARINNQLR